jgi:Flp pilus assembly protein TadG
MAIVYAMVALMALMGIASLAVDVGRAQLAKSQLQTAADAAARYAVAGLSQSVTVAIDRAVAAAAENKVEGTPVVLDRNNDIEFGIWDAGPKTFTVLTGNQRSGATAVRVTLRRSQARGNAIPTVFAQMLGRSSVDVKATSIVTRGRVVTPVVDARACPWLAGMSNGSTVAPYGGNPQTISAPTCSPELVQGVPLVPGAKLSFRQTGGNTGDSTTNGNNLGLDGNASLMAQQQAANGINSTRAPRGALMGIFLDDRAPNTYAQAPAMDFNSANSRNFTELSPGLKQVFFIGDGVNNQNQLQEFVVPAGATRFYLGIMDEKGWWWDNTGEINTTMLDAHIMTVQ